MIVGAGLIGTSLTSVDVPGITVFASGVSNSQETNSEFFRREQQLLESYLVQDSHEHLIYISTCSVSDTSQTSSPYIQHKKNMEELTLTQSDTSVVRLPNVVGPTGNKRNLVRHFVGAILSGKKIYIQESARRYLLGVDEMKALISAYSSQGPRSGQVIEFVPPLSTSVVELVGIIEEILDVKADAEVVPGGSSYPISFEDTLFYSRLAGIEFPEEYTRMVLERWVPRHVL